VTYPPNPNRPLNNRLNPDQAAGRKLFDTVNCGIPSAPELNGIVLTCAGCHAINPKANPDSTAPGFFGSSSLSSFDFNPQLFKTPHLRNLYQKIGMFGNPENPGFPGGDNSFQGEQVRGFGLLHDGSVDTVFRFVHGVSFSESFNGPGNNGIPDGPAGDVQRRQLEAFLLAFPTNLAPVVGQQTTLTKNNAAVVGARINLLIDRARAGECDLVVKSGSSQGEKGYLFDVASGLFVGNRRRDAPLSDASLRQRALQKGGELTYTCTPPGSGIRAGIDRDEDGVLDGDEVDAGSDPANPTRTVVATLAGRRRRRHHPTLDSNL
jgi:hypothetical protein